MEENSSTGDETRHDLNWHMSVNSFEGQSDTEKCNQKDQDDEENEEDYIDEYVKVNREKEVINWSMSVNLVGQTSKEQISDQASHNEADEEDEQDNKEYDENVNLEDNNPYKLEGVQNLLDLIADTDTQVEEGSISDNNGLDQYCDQENVDLEDNKHDVYKLKGVQSLLSMIADAEALEEEGSISDIETPDDQFDQETEDAFNEMMADLREMGQNEQWKAKRAEGEESDGAVEAIVVSSQVSSTVVTSVTEGVVEQADCKAPNIEQSHENEKTAIRQLLIMSSPRFKRLWERVEYVKNNPQKFKDELEKFFYTVEYDKKQNELPGCSTQEQVKQQDKLVNKPPSKKSVSFKQTPVTVPNQRRLSASGHLTQKQVKPQDKSVNKPPSRAPGSFKQTLVTRPGLQTNQKRLSTSGHITQKQVKPAPGSFKQTLVTRPGLQTNQKRLSKSVNKPPSNAPGSFKQTLVTKPGSANVTTETAKPSLDEQLEQLGLIRLPVSELTKRRNIVHLSHHGPPAFKNICQRIIKQYFNKAPKKNLSPISAFLETFQDLEDFEDLDKTDLADPNRSPTDEVLDALGIQLRPLPDNDEVPIWLQLEKGRAQQNVPIKVDRAPEEVLHRTKLCHPRVSQLKGEEPDLFKKKPDKVSDLQNLPRPVSSKQTKVCQPSIAELLHQDNIPDSFNKIPDKVTGSQNLPRPVSPKRTKACQSSIAELLRQDNIPDSVKTTQRNVSRRSPQGIAKLLRDDGPDLVTPTPSEVSQPPLRVAQQPQNRNIPAAFRSTQGKVCRSPPKGAQQQPIYQNVPEALITNVSPPKKPSRIVVKKSPPKLEEPNRSVRREYVAERQIEDDGPVRVTPPLALKVRQRKEWDRPQDPFSGVSQQPLENEDDQDDEESNKFDENEGKEECEENVDLEDNKQPALDIIEEARKARFENSVSTGAIPKIRVPTIIISTVEQVQEEEITALRRHHMKTNPRFRQLWERTEFIKNNPEMFEDEELEELYYTTGSLTRKPPKKRPQLVIIPRMNKSHSMKVASIGTVGADQISAVAKPPPVAKSAAGAEKTKKRVPTVIIPQMTQRIEEARKAKLANSVSTGAIPKKRVPTVLIPRMTSRIEKAQNSSLRQTSPRQSSLSLQQPSLDVATEETIDNSPQSTVIETSPLSGWRTLYRGESATTRFFRKHLPKIFPGVFKEDNSDDSDPESPPATEKEKVWPFNEVRRIKKLEARKERQKLKPKPPKLPLRQKLLDWPFIPPKPQPKGKGFASQNKIRPLPKCNQMPTIVEQRRKKPSTTPGTELTGDSSGNKIDEDYATKRPCIKLQFRFPFPQPVIQPETSPPKIEHSIPLRLQEVSPKSRALAKRISAYVRRLEAAKLPHFSRRTVVTHKKVAVREPVATTSEPKQKANQPEIHFSRRTARPPPKEEKQKQTKKEAKKPRRRQREVAYRDTEVSPQQETSPQTESRVVTVKAQLYKQCRELEKPDEC